MVGNRGLQAGEMALTAAIRTRSTTDCSTQGCDWQACPYKSVPTGERFGPDVW